MDDRSVDEQILNELRLQTRLYRKNYIPIFLVLIILIAFISFSAIFKNYTGKNSKSSKEVSLTWNQVEDLCDKGYYNEAEQKALIIVEKNDGDYYSHACIARIYLRKINLPKALKHAEIAYRLFPNKDNEETLEALNKLLASGPQKKSETK